MSRWLILVLLLAMLGVPLSAAVVFVDAAAAGANNGTSWANAYTNLSTALGAAVSGDELWVKAGTYKPTTTATRTISFQLKSGVNVYGGFAGSEGSRGERDWRRNQTILSGDIGAIGVATDNSYHVVVAPTSGSGTAGLDGCFVRDGYANGASPSDEGGGFYAGAGGGTATVRNCVFTSNQAPTFTGGAASMRLSGCVFEQCVFQGNTATYGGAIYTNGTTTVASSLLIGNVVTNLGGAAYSSSGLTLQNCTVQGNNNGTIAAIYGVSGGATVRNSVLWANTGGDLAGSGTVSFSVIQNGVAPWTDGGSNNVSSPAFVNAGSPAGADGLWATSDDGLVCTAGTALNNGTTTGIPTGDLRGAPRNQGAGPDRGAYETRASTLYVKKGASGNGSGNSWANAVPELREALYSADGQEIWVAAGTYKPTATSTRTISFTMKSGSGIYGGFAGTETLLSQRSSTVNQTVLSGDIGTIGVNTDNSYHVVSCTTSGTLDGFTVTGGKADGAGVLQNWGGGMLIDTASATPTVSNCVFLGNSTSFLGGAVANNTGAAPTFTACVFSGNSSAHWGGAIFNYSTATSVSWSNLVFQGNTATNNGGAIANQSFSSLNLTNVTLYNNSSANAGGIYYTSSSNGTLTNCILWGNTATTKPQIDAGGNVVTANNCVFEGGLPAGVTNNGGNLSSDPLFFNTASPAGPDGIFATFDDGLNLGNGSPDFDNGAAGPTTDIVGRPRPVGSGVDRGAYERSQLLYVNVNAVGSNKGSSWANAYTNLQSALSVALTGDQIWVAAGTYKPTTGTDTSISFNLVGGTAVYGGFAGSETLLSQRSAANNRTILSGDIGTIGINTDNSKHVVTCFATGVTFDGFTVRDGNSSDYGGGMYNDGSITLTVSNCAFISNAAQYGAGMANESGATVTASNCVFSGNTAAFLGGGVHDAYANSAHTWTNCEFIGNSSPGGSYNGAGIFIEGSPLTMVNCTFGGNTGILDGGAITAWGSTSPVFKNCILWGNTGGTQIHNQNGATSTAINCITQGGLSAGTTDGGGNLSSDPRFININNLVGPDNIPGTADDGVVIGGGSPAINAGTATGAPAVDLLNNPRPLEGAHDIGAFEVDVVYAKPTATGTGSGNSWADACTLQTALAAARPAGQIWVAAGTYKPTATTDRTLSFTMLKGCGLYGGFAGSELLGQFDNRTWVVNKSILSGDIGTASVVTDNSYHVVVGASAPFDGFIVRDGYADGGGGSDISTGGGMFNTLTASPLIANCVFTANSAPNYTGGAIVNGTNSGFHTAMPRITNCLFVGNTANYGGAVFSWDQGGFNAVNCTFNTNTATFNGGVFYSHASATSTLKNCILWGDTSSTGPEIYYGSGTATLTNCTIQGGLPVGVTDGGGNFVTDPQFAASGSPAGPDGIFATNDDGLRLLATSPAVDSGSGSGTDLPTSDLLGTARPLGGSYDRGAYEGKVGVVAFSATSSSGLESVTSVTIPVTLTAASDLTITVNYAVTSATATGGGVDYTLASGVLTFTPGVTSQNVVLSVVSDAVVEPDENLVIALSSPTNAILGINTTHTCTIQNDDTAGITVSPTAGLITTEAAGTATFTVVLTSQPTGSNTVVVSLTSSNPAEGTVSSPSITFTTGNWSAPQTITITGVNDFVADGNIGYTIITSASSGDSTYNAINPSDVSVTNNDNDVAGFVITPSSGLVTTEAGGTATFTVNLSSQPTGANVVTMSLTSSNTAEGTVSPSGLSFSSANWSTPVTVTVTGVNDLVMDGNISYSIITGNAVSGDSSYSGMVVTDVTVTNNDNDVAGVQLSKSTVTLSESGTSDTYTVVLTSQPVAAVTITLLSSDGQTAVDDAGTAGTQNFVSFDSSNWNSPKTVTVSAIDDLIVEGAHTGIITHSLASADPNYNSITVNGVTANITDNDTAGVTVTQSGGTTTVSEATPATGDTYTVSLNTQPLITPALLKDINSGISASSPSNFTQVGSLVYFVATDVTNGTELWKSDGTLAGTSLVKDICPGATGSSPSNLTDVNGTLFFSANDGTNGNELWTSNGTSGGTVMVANIVIGAGSSSPTDFVNLAGTLLFSADDGVNGRELWKCSGGSAALVSNINPGIASSLPTVLVNSGGFVYFSASNGTNGFELWRSDGSAAGTIQVMDIRPGAGASSSPAGLTDVNGTLFFSADDGSNGIELWKVVAGTASLVSNISTGSASSSPTNLTAVGSTLFFSATEATNGMELWKSDGTTTTLVKNINASSDSVPGNLVNVGGVLFFSANDGTNGRELWKSDGSTAGTVLVKDIAPGALSSLPNNANFTNVNGVLYFRANDSVSGMELWRSDGTAAGTVLVKDINPSGSASISGLTNAGGMLFFGADSGTTGSEVWIGGTASVTITATVSDGQTVVDTDLGTGGNQNTLTFTGANWNIAQMVTVYAVNDALFEANPHPGSITHASASTGVLGNAAYNGVAVASVTASITDNDTAPTVTFSVASQSSSEATATMTITVNQSAISGLSTSIPFSVGGTATGGGTDYTITASPVTIAAGASSATITITVVNDALNEANETVVVTMGSPTNATQGAITAHTATITDNDAVPTVAFTSATQSGAESVGTMTVTAQLSAVSGQLVTVPFTVTGTASGGGTDYSITASPVTIAAGSTTANITITVVNDVLDEADETVVITMGAPTNATQGGVIVHTATITDDDATPTVTFTSAAQSAAENVGTMTITAQLSAVSGQLVSIPFTATGTATGGGTDYSITASPVTIAAGSTTATITITVNNDAIDEADETVVITMGTPTNAGQGVTTVHTATITDDDAAPTVTFTAVNQTVAESVGTATITAQLSAISGQTVTVPFTVGGTATGGGVDFTIITASPVTIAAGATTGTITVTVIDDLLNELSETVIVTMGTPTNAGLGATTVHTITVTDNDTQPTVAFTAAVQSQAENLGAMTATVQLSALSGQTVTVPFSVTGTATGGGTDYTITTSPVTIAAGSLTTTVTISVVNDALNEASETVVLTLGSPTNATLGATQVHTATITNDDALPTVQFTAASQSGAESVGTMTVTVQLSAVSGQLATIPFTLTGSTATGGGIDYSITASPLTIAAGSTTATATITVVNDAIDENDETVILTMGTPTNASQGAITVHTATIIDNDTAGVTIVQSAGSTDISEAGPSSDTYTMVLNSQPVSDVTITVTPIVTGPGIQTTVSTALGNTLVFTSVNWNIPQTVTVTADNDAFIEGAHTGTITHSASGDIYGAVSIANVVANITDNDTPAILITETLGDTTVTEGGLGDTYTVVLAATPTANVTITINAGAQASVDKTTLIFNTIAGDPISGNTSGWNVPQTVTVSAINDVLDEVSPMTVSITHAAASSDTNYNGLVTGLNISVIDNDPTPTLAIAGTSVVENVGGGTATITVTMTGQSAATVSVDYATANGTALAGSDYTAASGTLTWTPGQTGAKTFTVTIANDAVNEADETFTVSIANAVNASIATPSATATITNDDAPPTIAFSTGSQSVAESAGTATITAQLSAISGQNVSMAFTVTGTAVGSGTDYTITASPLIIPAGSISGSLTVSIVDDVLNEAAETVIVTQGALTNATAGAPTAHTLTITDNDTAPTVAFTSAGQSAAESAGTMTVTAQLSAVSGQTVTVPFTVGGTATGGGTDYSITASPVTIAAGLTSAPVTITVVDDALYEASETVVITMGTPTNATQGAVTVHTATITDNDVQPTVNFTSASQTAAENIGTMTVTAQLSAVSGQAVTVPFTVSGTATGGGTDYTITASPVTIAAGTTTGTITITVNDDALNESSETVVITMGSPTNATAGGTAVHTATITDNDAAPSVTFTSASQTAAENIGTMTITAQLSAVSGQTVTVPFTVGGTAMGSGTDYTITASPVTIAAGATTATITVTVVDDALDEASETVVVTMSAPTNATLGATTVHTATITDNDPTPTVTFTSASQTVAENVGSTTITAQLSAVSGQTVTVPFTVGGTATGGGTDYTITASPVTIAAGATTTTITVMVADDALNEAAETVVVTMGTPTNASLGATTVHTVTITDNDAQPTVVFTAASQSQAENLGTMTATMQLSAVSGQTVTVPFTVTGTATGGGTDYTITASPVTIAAGATTTTVTISVVNDALNEANETVVLTLGTPTNATLGATQVHTATITNDDALPTVQFTAASQSGAENVGTMTATVQLSAVSGQTVTVPFTVTGSATGGGVDYTITSSPLTIAAGATTATVTITVINDAVDEANEDVVLTLNAPNNATLGVTQVHTATIIDDDTVGVTIVESGGSTNVSEAGPTSDTYTVVLNSQPTASVTITLTPDAQVTLGAPTLTFTTANWNVAQTMTVTAVDDALAEGLHSGTVVYAVSGGGYGLFSIPNQVVSITDNDSPGVLITESAGSTNVTEGGAGDTYTVRLATQPTFNVTITINAGTQASVDKTTLTFTPTLGQAVAGTTSGWNVAQTVTVNAVDDTNYELTPHPGTISHTAASSDINYGGIAIGNVAVSITDNDAIPTLAVADVSVSEATATVTVTVTMTGTSALTTSVNYATANGTALAAADYTAASGTLTWTPGQTGAKTFTVPILNDALDEADETFEINLSTATNSTISRAVGFVTITDDDAAPSVTFTTASQSVAESIGTTTVTAQLSVVSGQAVTVPFTLSGTATSGSDYSATASPLTIAAGATSAAITFTITDDALDEVDETIVVTMGVPTNASQGATVVHTLTITDNDATPSVSFGSAGQSSGEASGTMTIAVALSAVSGQAVSVPFSLSGTATSSGVDYSITSSPLVISAGAASGTITITVVNDALDEADETVIVTLGAPTNATLGATTVHTATILDDDATPTVAFTAASQSAAENVGTMTVTAQLSAVSGQAVTVPFTVTGTATGGGTDYTITASPVTIAAGATTGTITITVIDDALNESSEMVVITMGSPTNATPGGTTVHTATITDNDATPTVTFTTASQTAAENIGTMTITAQLSAVSGQTVTVPFTVGGTATGSGTDYTITASPVTIAAGATTATITVTVVDDALDEASETVVVTMSAPTNATLGATTVHTATITDNDPTPTVTFTSASQTVGENVGSTTITAQLSAVSGQDVTIPFTVGGTATGAGTDYTITGSPVTITAGGTTATVTVTVVNDVLNEANETVVVTMGSPTNASLGATTVHTVTITDNDTQPTVAFTAASQSQAENLGTMTATMQLSAVSGQTVTVPFTVTGTATGGGTDYTITASPVTIAAGATTTTVTISVVNDALNEANETVVLTLGTPTNATLGATQVHTATIANDDALPTVQFTAASQSGAESVGTMTATVQLSAVSGQLVTIPFTLTGSTATGGGTDYSITASPLTIAAGATTAAVTITVINDAVDEADETVVLTLGSPTNASLGVTQVHTATIIDDDTVGVTIVESGGSTNVSESGTSDTYTVVLKSQPTVEPTTITLTADAQVRVNGGASTVLTFTTATWNVAQTVTVTAVDDAVAEAAVHPGNITYVVASSDAAYNGLAIPTLVVNVTDNDSLGVLITESAGSTNVIEGGAGDTYTVKLGTLPTGTVTITINPGSQCTVSPSTLTFTTGNYAIAQTVNVSAIDDVVSEPSPHLGTISHTAASSDTNYNGIAISNVAVSITDNDAAPTLAIANVSALEGATATVTATMTGTSSSTVTVAFTTVDGTATSAGLDYTAISGTLTWTPGQFGAQTFSVVTAADALDEDDETVSLVLSSPVNATITQASAVLTITDNNALPTVAFTAAAQSPGESSGSTTATVQLSAISGRSVTVPFTVSGTATAGAGNDYTISTSPLTIPAGSLSTAITIVVLDDAVDEPNETVIITLGAATNATVSGVTVHTATIVDDDATPTVGFVSAGQSAAESAGSATIAVALSAVSGQSVSVPFSVTGTATGGGTDYTITVSPLVIPAGAAGGIITVTITGDALNEDDETVVVTLGAPTNATLDVVTAHTLTILDNDPLPTVAFTAAVSSALEPVAARTITAQLSAASGRTVTVPFTITGSATLGSDYTVTASPLTFAPLATTASITVTVIDDSVSEPDETVVVTLGSPTNATLGATTVHTATIQDNEGAVTVSFDAASPSTPENGAAMILTARLSATAGLDVTVPFTLSGTATLGVDYTIDASPVVISAGSTTTTITITPIDDAVAESAETVIVTMGTPTNATAGAIPAITATITDNDSANVTIVESGTTTAATEGGVTDDYTIVLSSQPSGDVTITVSVDAQVSVSPATLTFTSVNYNVPQTVTVSAVDDAIFEGAHTGTISHSASGGGYTGVVIAGITATITDNDTRGLNVVVLTPPLVVSEAGGTDSYTVALTSQPTADVTLAMSSPDGQVTTTPTSLTFTATNWNTPQSLTVAAINDFVDEASPHIGTIAYTATGGGYTGVTLTNTIVAVIDNDTAGVVVVPSSGLTTTEAGGITIFVVALASQPTADVTINLSSSNPAEGSVTPSSLTFTPANWFISRGVLVTGVDDAIDDGDVFYSIITDPAISADPNYNGMVVPDVGVLNIDNDTAGVTVTVAGSTSIAEGAGSFSYSLTLNSQPTGSVTISTILDGQLTATPAALTFTALNWNTPQSIVVAAVDDQVDEASPHTGVIAHSANGPGYSGVSVANVTASITDNDTAGITIAPLVIVVGESGTSQSFTAVLTSQPTSNVTLLLASTDTTEGTVSPTSLTFTPSNWNTPQSATVTGVNDAIADGTVNYFITTSAASGDANYNGIAVADVAASTTDNDVPGILVSPISGLTTSEGGGSALFTVVLLSQPVADVRIDMSSSDIGEGVVSPAFLTFTSLDWNLPRNVTVTGVDDSAADGNIPYTINLAPALSGDPNYAGRVSPSVAVTNQDNDTAAVIITQSAGFSAITEGGGTDTYDIRLATQPPAGSPVTITISADAQSTVSPTVITFTDSDWNLPKSITITAVNDQIAEGTHTSVISHVASGGGYGAVTISPVTALITDNDTALIVVTPTTGLVTTEAGGAATFTVRLNSQPTGNVIIDFASNNLAEGTVSPAQVIFTSASAPASGSWNTPVTITVTGIADVVPTVQGSVSYQIVGTVNLTTADATYGALTVPSVSVTGLDSDVASLKFTLVSSSAETTEYLGPNHTCTFNVTLTSRPTQDVTVTLVSNTPAKGVVTTGASLTFTNGNWNVAQQVTVTAVNNHTDDGDIIYLLGGSTASLDGNYSGVVTATSLASRDDHLPDVVVKVAGLTGINRGVRATIKFLDPVAPASTPNGLIGASDAETAAPGNGLIYTIQLVPGQGALRRHVISQANDPTGTLLVPGATFTQGELRNDQITYTHNGGTGGTDGFAFTVTDADTTVSALSVLNITINLGLLPPQVTLVPGPVAYTENAAPVAIDGANGTTQVFDPDSGVASAGQNFQGGDLTVTVSGGTALDIVHDLIGIRNQGTGSGQIGLGVGGTVTYGTGIGTVDIGTITSTGIGGPLTVTFTNQAHNTEVTALLKNITFSNDSNFPSANVRTLTVIVLDASGGAASTPATVTVNVTRVNDLPTISAPILFTAPGAAVAGTVTSGDPDLPLDTLAFTVPVRNAPNGPTKGTVTLNAATGAFSYLPDSSSTGVEIFTVTVTDLAGAPASAAVTVLISDPGAEHPWIITDPPMMEDGATLSYTFTVDVSAFPQTPTASALTYTLVGNLTPITTWSINPQTATSATLNLTHTALLGSYLTLGIVVTDTTNQSTGLQWVTLLIVLPGAAQ